MNKSFYMFAGILSGLVVCLYLFATKSSMGISLDSLEYIFSAHTFIDGQGFRSIHGSAHDLSWQTHFPPGLPVLLGTLGSVFHTDNLIQISRYCNAIFLLATMFLISHILFVKLKNQWLPLLAVLFLVFIIDFFKIYMMVWSEPMFMLLMFASLWCLSLYLENSKMKFLFLSASLVAIAAVTRYLGITLILSGCIILLFRPALPFKIRFVRSALYGLISSSLLFCWMLRNYWITSEGTDRKFSFHPMGKDYLVEFLFTVKSFLIQFPMQHMISVFVGSGILLLTLALLVYFRKQFFEFLRNSHFGFILFTYIIIFCSFMVFSNTFLDFSPLYFRILFPIFACAFILFILPAKSFLEKYGFSITSVWGKLLMSSVGCFFLLHFFLFYKFISVDQELGDYNSESWKKSETLAFLKTLSEKDIIYTSEPDGVFILSGKTVSSIKILPHDYEMFKGRKQYVFVFKNGRYYDNTNYKNPFSKKLSIDSINLVKEFQDGKVYEIH